MREPALQAVRRARPARRAAVARGGRNRASVADRAADNSIATAEPCYPELARQRLPTSFFGFGQNVLRGHSGKSSARDTPLRVTRGLGRPAGVQWRIDRCQRGRVSKTRVVMSGMNWRELYRLSIVAGGNGA